MKNLTVGELYDAARIEGAQLDIRFDYPHQGDVTLAWFKGGYRYARTFSCFEVNSVALPGSIVRFAREQAESEFNQCER